VVPATIGARFFSRVVDGAIVLVPISFLVGVVTASLQGRAIADLPWWSGLVVSLLLVAVESAQLATRSTTVGKRLHTLLVVAADSGAPLGWGRAVARTVTVPATTIGVSAIASPVWVPVATLLMLLPGLVDSRHRTVPDLVAGTAVVADLRPQGTSSADGPDR
jgi:hypothetical protein